MPIDFPNSPTVGDTYTVGTKTWQFNGTSWDVIIGDVVIGSISVDSTMIENNAVELGTKTTGNYVASLVAGTGVTLTNNSGESATPTVAIVDQLEPMANATMPQIKQIVTKNKLGEINFNP